MLETISAYLTLSKARIVLLVTISTVIGFFLGGNGIHSIPLLMFTIVGIALVTAGGAALNQYLERDADAKMHRTQDRPLPSEFISPSQALKYGINMVLVGLAVLIWKVNLLVSFLALLSAFLYVLVYTPLKKYTWWNTFIGAIPGAIPPMIGWAAASNDLEIGAWVLFAIIFVWQFPHFYPLAWMFREDYARGGFKMLPVIEPDGKSTFRQIIWYSILLIPVSTLPTFIEMAGQTYLFGAVILSVAFLGLGILFVKTKTFANADKLFKASLVYLPLLFILIVFDFKI
ncbi:MAG: protoheme IX farnesyltransferase [Calditrichaeota bacterium]|nr:MAG: protoheme IX farnesyltransferase [Calditrichota bacterium]